MDPLGQVEYPKLLLEIENVSAQGVINRTGRMRYRTLGRTGIRVSELSFGSHLKKQCKDDPAWRRRQIRVGLENGINCFDVYEHSYKQFAPMSEALADVIDQVVLSLVSMWDVPRVADEIDYALRVFGRDTIDLYRFVVSDKRGPWEGRLDALLRAKRQGKVRSVGMVVHDPKDLLSGLERRGAEVEYVMAPVTFYSTLVIDPTREVSTALRRHQVGLIAMKPMGAADAHGSYMHKLRPAGEEFDRLRAKGLSIGKLAVKFLLQSDLVSTVMPAMNAEPEVLENVEACGDGALTGDEQRFLDLYRAEADRSLHAMLPKHDYWIGPWKA